MDAHLITKIIHMSAVSLLILVFVARAATLFVGTEQQQPSPKVRKGFVGLQHLSLTLIIITGAILLVMNNFEVQPWFYAKVILFFVLWSSMLKTYREDSSILLVQRRIGVLIGAIALVGILGLVMMKPVFG
ncbi:SirB2 family protein [Acinetobacter sp. 3657]|uniref:SirB2 family protein n=1 Tax=Acinetobacter sp. 3657 TaxID=2817764 RepID=UPI00285DA270|nr:putative membrane protein SirB2 [Prolinoborus sp. 3657]